MRVRKLIGPQAISLARSSPRLIAAILLAYFCCALQSSARAQTADTIQVWSSPAPPSNPSRGEKYTVAGTVINAVTGEPIRKALVQLRGLQQRTTFTDGDGRFQFDGISAGQVALVPQKPGYFGEQEMRRDGQLPIQVGPKSDSVVLKLTPEGVIAGKVTTATGTPLEHVPLSLTYLNVREGRRHFDSKGLAITTEDGRYRFANLLPGTYYLAAEPFTPLPETLFDFQPDLKTGYPGVYYPGVPDLASSSPISLSAGQQAEANFSLEEVPSYNISGTISGYLPNQGVNLQLCDQSGSPVSFSYQFSPDNGRFDFHGVPAGVYVLKAFSQSAPNQPVRAEARLNVASNIFNLHLTLGPATSILVSVRTESVAQSTPGGTHYAFPSPSGPPLGVRLLASRSGTSDSYATLDASPARQTLILRNVEPGRYTAELMPQDPWYVQSAEYGQTNLLTDDLTLTADAPALTMEVLLRNDVASLSGTVTPRSGADVPATVVAIPERLPKASAKLGYYNPPRDKSANRSDGFLINSLAPGDYLVFAFDHADGVEYSNPDVLQNYVSQATHVTLAPNQRARVTLDLIRIGEASN
ncbi:MAG TPA: carboxypeptidase-like regulatory domain-containing protein [Terriglobales bacterium]